MNHFSDLGVNNKKKKKDIIFESNYICIYLARKWSPVDWACEILLLFCFVLYKVQSLEISNISISGWKPLYLLKISTAFILLFS